MARSAEYNWQKERRRMPTKPGRIPVQGFGPHSAYTLWLVSPAVGRKYKFVNGKPFIEAVGESVNDPELVRLRDLVMLKTLPAEPSTEILKCVLRVDLSIFEYAAYLISLDYTVSDDDLEFILPADSGAKWINSMLVHAAGGKDSVAALSRIDPQRLSDMLAMNRADPVEVAVQTAVTEMNADGGIIIGQSVGSGS